MVACDHTEKDDELLVLLESPVCLERFTNYPFLFLIVEVCFQSLLPYVLKGKNELNTTLFYSLETDEGTWVSAADVKSKNYQIITDTIFKDRVMFAEFTLFLGPIMELGFKLPRSLGNAEPPSGEHPRNNPLFSVSTDSLFFAITVAKEELYSDRFSVDVAQGIILTFFLFCLLSYTLYHPPHPPTVPDVTQGCTGNSTNWTHLSNPFMMVSANSSAKTEFK